MGTKPAMAAVVEMPGEGRLDPLPDPLGRRPVPCQPTSETTPDRRGKDAPCSRWCTASDVQAFISGPDNLAATAWAVGNPTRRQRQRPQDGCTRTEGGGTARPRRARQPPRDRADIGDGPGRAPPRTSFGSAPAGTRAGPLPPWPVLSQVKTAARPGMSPVGPTRPRDTAAAGSSRPKSPVACPPPQGRQTARMVGRPRRGIRCGAGLPATALRLGRDGCGIDLPLRQEGRDHSAR